MEVDWVRVRQLPGSGVRPVGEEGEQPMSRRRQAVTIKHVAADAGAYLQTISRVINKEPNVRPEMQRRVQQSIDKPGYVPSIAAQRMSGSRLYLILAINDRDRTIADWQARQGTDWIDQMLLGGMLKCAEHGYQMIFELVDTHSDHVERELLGAIASLRPDGVILTPPHSDNPQIVALLAKQAIPFARIGPIQNGAGIPVSMDDEGSSRKATQYLTDRGHRRMGGEVALASLTVEHASMCKRESVAAPADIQSG